VPVGALQVLKNGLLLDVLVGPSAPLKALLWRQGKEVVPPIRSTFLVDTGADNTMVSEQLMRSLRLERTGQTRVVTSTSGPTGQPSDVFGVELELFPQMPQSKRWGAVDVVGRPFDGLSIDGLLGRDLLSYMVLTYNGPRGEAFLTF
jgi:hypothetical protein